MWAYSRQLKHLKAVQRGFTIVELLIVVVVIAILAAITIVSYNGIQNRAKASAAQTAAEQAGKKLATYAAIKSDMFPDEITDPELGLPSGASTYQYWHSADMKSYCVTATTNGVSYFVSNNTGKPTPGACDGHAADGGTVITNYVPNPTFASGMGGAFTSTSFGQASTNTTPSTGGPTNGSFLRRTYSGATTGFAGGADIISLGGSYSNGLVFASPSQVFSASTWVRSSKVQSVRPQIQWLNASNASAGVTNGSDVTLAANTWTRLTVTGAVAPAAAVSVRLDLDGGLGAVQWANGDTLDYTMLMLTEGPTNYSFADGNTAKWLWQGTVNNSRSYGPAV